MTKRQVLNIPVDFGGVSIGDGTVRVGIQIDREDMELTAGDEMLCGRRLTGKIVVCPNDEAAEQQTLPGMVGMKHELSGAFDVKRFGVAPKVLTAGLTFALVGLDVAELGFFAKKSGRLLVSGVETIAEDEDGAGEEEDEDDEDDEEEAESLGKKSDRSGRVKAEGKSKSEKVEEEVEEEDGDDPDDALEANILRMSNQGQSQKGIAEELDVSERTVRKVLGKL